MGPVLLYERGPSPKVLVAYDVGHQRAVWSATIQGSETAFIDAAVVKGGVVLITRNAAYLQGFDGSRLMRLLGLKAGWEAIHSVATAPDGVTVAFSISRPALQTPAPNGTNYQRIGNILFYDLAARREIREVEGSDPTYLSEGPIQWRGDGRGVYLHSLTYSHGPGPQTTVFTDGTVKSHDLEGFVHLSRDSRKVIHGTTEGCNMSIGGHDLYATDLDSGRRYTHLHDESRDFAGLEWSPDGSEFLVWSRTHLPNPDCSLPLQPSSFQVWNLNDNTIRDVPDIEPLFRRWYGDELVWVDCSGEFGGFMSGLHRFRYLYCVDRPLGTTTLGTLRYRDLEIDSTSYYYRFYGFTTP